MLSVLTSVLTIGPHYVPIFGIGGWTVNSVNCQSDHPLVAGSRPTALLGAALARQVGWHTDYITDAN